MTKLQKDHLMILLESIDSKVQASFESFSIVNNKIDNFRDEIKEDIAILDCKIMGLSERVDAVEKNLTARISEVDKKLSDRIDEVDKKLSDRIDEVDKKLSDRIDAVYDELVAHRNNTEQHTPQTKRTLKNVKMST